MQALMHPSFVKIASSGVKANATPVNGRQQPADEKPVGTRFLAILLSCLSACAGSPGG